MPFDRLAAAMARGGAGDPMVWLPRAGAQLREAAAEIRSPAAVPESGRGQGLADGSAALADSGSAVDAAVMCTCMVLQCVAAAICDSDRSNATSGTDRDEEEPS